jgi:(4S)-4-hydroxy-5-phosphonooxypentane-2,3-dione isomerase
MSNSLLVVHVHVHVKPESVEAFRTPQAPAAHKETAHYLTWRDTVAPMMAEPRTSRKYVNRFPEDAGW